MPLGASRLTWIISSNSGSLYCTVYRMSDCREGILHLRGLDYVIVQMHRVLGHPRFANSVRFSFITSFAIDIGEVHA